MLKETDWLKGEAFFRENVPELVPFIDKYGHCDIQPDSDDKYFDVLMMGIASQQLPPDKSIEIMDKVRALCGSPVEPEAFLKLKDEELRACELADNKIAFMRRLSEKVVSGEIDFSAISEMEDSAVLKMLKQVKGLGQWTIEMFMFLSLARQDVIPGDDFLLQKGVQKLYDLKKPPKRGQVKKLTEHWQPWRSLGVWYMLQDAGKDWKK